jgi:hypothetical protein
VLNLRKYSGSITALLRLRHDIAVATRTTVDKMAKCCMVVATPQRFPDVSRSATLIFPFRGAYASVPERP